MPSHALERPGAPFPQHFRLKHSRSKKGCLSCRQRKKKCDETRPRCTACKRSSLDCAYLDERRVPTRDDKTTSAQSLSSFNYLTSTGSNRACDLTPQSVKLLEHYTMVTAILLPAWTQTKAHNPFINFVLPLAHNDDLLMHAVLAVSGAHLSHKLADTALVEQATYKHYSSVLRKLRNDISQGHFSGTNGIVRLLSVLAFLCQYEILAGSGQTTLSLHFQAIQQTFSRLRNLKAADTTLSDEANDIVSWIYEGYSYMVLCNLIIPTPEPVCSTDFILEAAATLGLKLPQSLSTIFGGSRLLFEMIPRANALFCLRLAEQSAGEVAPTSAFLEQCAELSLAIEVWKMPLPPSPPAGHQSSEHNAHLSEWAQSNMAAEFIRHALRIYILTAQLGSDTPTPDIEAVIQINVEAMVRISLIIAATPCASNLMWAVIVGGSCTRDESYRQLLAYWLKNSNHQMRHLSSVLKALELLWADPSPKAFGPYGLRYIYEKHNLNFCIM